MSDFHHSCSLVGDYAEPMDTMDGRIVPAKRHSTASNPAERRLGVLVKRGDPTLSFPQRLGASDRLQLPATANRQKNTHNILDISISKKTKLYYPGGIFNFGVLGWTRRAVRPPEGGGRAPG